MGQYTFIDSDDLALLKIRESQAKSYRECFEEIEKELYPNLISVDSCTCLQYDCWILKIMADELKRRREPWYKRLLKGRL